MIIPLELYALGAGLFYAGGNVLVKIGLVKDAKSNATSATFLTMLANFAFMWVAYFVTSPPALVVESLLIFCLSGVTAQCVARTFNYVGIEKLGVSVSTPVSSTTPLFSAIIALVILNEALSPQIGLGIVLVVFGIVVMSLRRGIQNRRKGWSKWDILFPVGAALFYGAADCMRKAGLNIFNSPISGATIGISAALAAYLPYLTFSGKIREVTVSKRSFWYLLSGFCSGMAWILYFSGLSIGKVTTMAPIKDGSNPLIALLLTLVFLRDKEEITIKTVVGALTVVLGVVVISLYS
jgi:transporter family protein